MRRHTTFSILLLFFILACVPAFALSASQKAASYYKNPLPEGESSDAQSSVPLDSLSAEIVRQVNAERAKAGLSPLSADPELTRLAAIRAEEITRKFSHTRPDGSSWSSVSSSVKGENIAMGYKTADKVMAAWLTSPGHRANILRESFSAIGVCAIEAGGIRYWVQLFGRK